MKNNKSTSRRAFIKNTALIAGTVSALPTMGFHILENKYKMTNDKIIGHGAFRYRVDKSWGNQDPSKIPVNDCHEMVMDKMGRLIMITNETKNNLLIYDKTGKVLDTWGDQFPGGHGLTLVNEGGEEYLFITDHDLHKVYKTTLDGRMIMELGYPQETGAYSGPEQYKPTEVAVGPNGDIYVADGYGLDWIIQYNHKGEYMRHFAGKGDGESQLNNAHGVCLDNRDAENPTLLCTSRAKQEFKRYTLDGQHIETIQTPGCWICRPVIDGDNLYFAVIVSKTWDNYDGFVLVMDKNNKVISAPGGSAPIYTNDILQAPSYDGGTFMNPHDVCVDEYKNLYIPQWNSGKSYPVRLEHI